MKNNKFGFILIILLLISSIFIVLFLAPIETNTYIKNGSLYINEIMSGNTYTITDKDGDYSDYIELYNGYDYDINLKGYYLSDSNNHYKWEFPDITIQANNYLLIYASGKDCYEEELHTNFKLDNKGEIVTLTNNNREVISSVKYYSMSDDMSYGYLDDSYGYFRVPTPGYVNSKYYSISDNTKNSNLKIRINEYNNEGLELYNYDDEDINLNNFTISFNKNEYSGYILDNLVIKKNEYAIIKYDETFKFGDSFNLYDENLKLIDSIEYIELFNDISYGYNNKKYVYYLNSSLGKENNIQGFNSLNEISSKEKLLIINEVSPSKNGIEIKNISNETINLNNYKISNNNSKVELPNIDVAPGEYYVFYGLKINNSNEVITLYSYDNTIMNEFVVGKVHDGGSKGLNGNNNIVIFSNDSLEKDNGNDYYLGYINKVIFSIQGGYTTKGTKLKLTSLDGTKIYYTLDGSFPTKNSILYNEPIEINETTIVKAIAVKDNYIDSDVESRTFLVNDKHDIAYISISSDYNNLFGVNGLLSNANYYDTNKISLEFYEADGSFGTSFIGDAKLSGNFGGSRDKAQKGMTIYLRSKYGNNTISYNFFGKTQEYSSILLRNGGEDYLNIHILDAALQKTLIGQMDLDMQDYRPVVVYFNGKYYGIYNLRDKLNADYIKNIHNVDKDDVDIIKYNDATKGTTTKWKELMNYLRSHDVTDDSVYEYLESQIDMQEICNYWIVQSYYTNTDIGNIKYWKSSNGKWRMMLYDIDWSLYFTDRTMIYPVKNVKIPAVTYISDTVELPRKLYQNDKFRDLYLTTLAYHLKNTFNPERMNNIVDELVAEIENEIPNHINRWKGTNSSLGDNIATWKNNINTFKNKITARYNYVINHLNEFELSKDEYNKYFGDIR